MRSAFSLVELSIVLVILGLLTGGILAGQNLIRAAELRSIVTDFQRYSTAVYTFRDKYFAIPGDMPNAEAFWGTANAVDANCIITNSGGAATCNGNGNGNIEGVTTRSNENFRFWQHLANAGLIEGTYTGVNGPGVNTFDSVVGENTPASKVSNAGFAALGAFVANAASSYFEGSYSIRLLFGQDGVDNTVSTGVLKPEEQWGIDTKIDDGKPGYGKILSYEGGTATSCATTAVDNTAEYQLTYTGSTCAIIGQPGW